jgi:hypothetical protein
MPKWNQYLDDLDDDSEVPVRQVEKIRRKPIVAEDSYNRTAKKDRGKDRPVPVTPK